MINRKIMKKIFQQKNTILMYHSISDEGRNYPYTVSVKDFRRQMQWLYDNKIKVQTLEETAEKIKNNQSDEEISVTITFDDGFLDNYTNALPILEDFGFKATFFIVTGRVGQINIWDSHEYGQKKLMDWKQINEIFQKGHIIGCHSHTHANLAEIEYEKAMVELKESWDILKKYTHAPFIPVAYPYGAYNQGTVELLKKIGVPAAVKISDSLRNNTSKNQYEITRFDVNSYVTQLHFKMGILNRKDNFYIKFCLEQMYLIIKKMYCDLKKGSLLRVKK